MRNGDCNTQTLSSTKAEILTARCLKFIGSFRGLLGLFVVVVLTFISIRFNWELGKLLSVDEESRYLLPVGYAALDLAGLFLSGYVAIRSSQAVLKTIAWTWFVFLLGLSLFAAASYSVSVDARLNQAGNLHLIEKHNIALEAIEQQITAWNVKLSNTVRFNRAYQKELNALQAQRDQHLSEIDKLQQAMPPAALAIFYRLPLPFNLRPAQAAAIMRFIWSAAMTMTPLLLVLLITSELMKTSKPDDMPSPEKQHPLPEELPENSSEFLVNQGTQRTVQVPVPVAQTPVTGHNQHTELEELRALEKVSAWLKRQQGRVNRNKLTHASGIRHRETVTRIIERLVKDGQLERMANGQLRASKKPVLKVVRSG